MSGGGRGGGLFGGWKKKRRIREKKQRKWKQKETEPPPAVGIDGSINTTPKETPFFFKGKKNRESGKWEGRCVTSGTRGKPICYEKRGRGTRVRWRTVRSREGEVVRLPLWEGQTWMVGDGWGQPFHHSSCNGCIV